MGLKEAYYSIEDAYYAELDELNKSIPIYKVIDPIDKVIPSLILLVVIVLGIAGGALLLYQQQPPISALTTVTLEFKDKNSGTGIAGAELTVIIGETTLNLTTSQKGLAVFEAKVGQSASFSFRASGYQGIDQNIVVEKEFFQSFPVSALVQVEKDKEMYFADGSGKMLDGKLITVYLSCSSGSAFGQAACAGGSLKENNTKVACTTSSGKITVIGKFIPKGCEKLLARASLAGYSDKDFEVGDGSTIKFEEAQNAKGKASITVKDEKGAMVDGAKVSVYDKDNILVPSPKLASYGKVEFDGLGVGTYYASAEKADYTSANSQDFEVKKGETAKATIVMPSIVNNSKLDLWVKEKGNNSPIAGATITMLSAAGKSVGEKATDSNGHAKYEVPAGQYHLEARLDTSYLGAEMDLNLYKGDNNSTILLEKLTALNSGVLVVQVKDEEEDNVPGAEVYLYEYEKGKKTTLANYDNRITGLDGTAKWVGVDENQFVAHARKAIAEGDSAPFTIKKAQQNNVSVKITIGETELTINASDKDSRPVPGAKVEFRTSGGESLGSILVGANGSVVHKLKADKTVYVIVSAPAGGPNYLSWVSQPIDLKPKDKVSLNAILLDPVSKGKPVIEFLGAFETASSLKPTTELKAGNSYLMKWGLKVPEAGPNGESLDQAGMHIRAGKSDGNQNLMENDPLYFVSVNSPSGTPLKGTTYSPGTTGGYDFDTEQTTSGYFKWANIIMDNDIKTGKAISALYTIAAIVKVRDDAQLYAPLTLNWRAWAKTGNGTYITSPDDSSASGAERLFYAATASKEYLAGVATECGSDLCYTGEWLADNDEKVSIKSRPADESTFSVAANAKNTLKFILLSNSDNVYTNAQFFAKAVDYSGLDSDAIKISSYKIIEPDNAEHNASFEPGAEKSKIDAIEIRSNWKKGGKLQVEISLALTGNDQTALRVYVKKNDLSRVKISGQEEKEITFKPAGKQMGISAFPKTLYSLRDQALSVTVKNEDGREMGGALVNLYKQMYAEAPTPIAHYDTGIDGNAHFTVPGGFLIEGASIIASASKAGYASAETTVNVSGSVVGIEPAPITASVNPTEIERKVDVTIKNNTNFDLSLTGLTLERNLKTTESKNAWEELDNLAMDNAVASFSNPGNPLPVRADSSVTQKFFMARFSAPDDFTPGKALGTLRFIVKNDSGKRWIKDVPVEVNIGYVTLDNPPGTNCLAINAPNWNATTLETNAITSDFELTNTCASNGSLVQLQNLKATITWNLGNVLGDVSLRLDDSDTGQSALVPKLMQNSSSLLFPSVEKGVLDNPKKYQGTITFTPLPGKVGNTTDFTVQISAELQAQGGTTPITSPGIKGIIGIMSLKQCITLGTDPQTGITMTKSPGATQTFTVTAKCGDGDVFVRFCNNDPECKGGVGERGITVSPGAAWSGQQATLKKDIATTITVSSPAYAGVYGITMQAKAPGKSWIDLPTKTMRVVVNPNSSQYFSLDKDYTFTLPGAGETDMAFLTNTGFEKSVNVRASKCDWQEASKIKWEQKLEFAVASTAIGCVVAFPIGCGVGAVIGIFNWLFGKDPCDDFTNRNLPEYGVNLSGKGPLDPPSTQRSLTLELSPEFNGQIIPVRFNSDVPDGFNVGDDVWEYPSVITSDGTGAETFGLQFQNAGANSTVPIYGLVTIKGWEYNYTNPVSTKKHHPEKLKPYNLRYFLDNKDWVQTVSIGNYSQTFHVAFNTAQQEQEPLVLPDALSCIDGVKWGSSGQAALPKIKLNWGWKESEGGIGPNDCNESNGVFCDATQLSIALSKRIIALDYFLGKNGHTFNCPTNPVQAAVDAQNRVNSSHTVPSDMIGIQHVQPELDGNNFTLHVQVKNNTNDDLNPTLTAIIDVPENADYTGDTIKNANIPFPKNSVTEYDFKFLDLNANAANDPYFVDLLLVGPVTNTEQAGKTEVGPFEIKLGQSEGCWLERSTKFYKVGNITPLEMYFNKDSPVFGRYVDPDVNVKWAPEVGIPNIEALRDLLHFHAQLMKDGYGRAFQQDFANYYTTGSLLDAPWEFVDSNSGLGQYFAKSDPYVLNFSRKGSDSAVLNSPGLYNVDIDISFGDNWDLYDQKGKPKAQIDVKFYRISQPHPDSAFYYLPFDGLVGLQPNSMNLERDGYGIAYNLLDGKQVNISSGATPVQTLVSSGSTNNQVVEVKTSSDFPALNTNIATRGNLLSLKTKSAGGVKELFISPSIPTPLMLKFYHNQTSDPFNSFYTLRNPKDQPENTGDTLTYWDGAGACLDFSGASVQEAFSQRPDQKATSADGLVNPLNVYKLHWDSASKPGTEYLKTIIYTPASEGYYSIKAADSNTRFVTPAPAYKEGSPAVQLGGIDVAAFNLSSISGLLQMVNSNVACISDSGTSASIWWNPKAVYEAKTGNDSIRNIEQSLGGERPCIR